MFTTSSLVTLAAVLALSAATSVYAQATGETPTGPAQTTVKAGDPASAAFKDQSCVKRSDVVNRCEAAAPATNEVRRDAVSRAALRSEQDRRAQAIAARNLKASQDQAAVERSRRLQDLQSAGLSGTSYRPAGVNGTQNAGAVVITGQATQRDMTMEERLADSMNPIQLDRVIIGSGNGTQHSWLECPANATGSVFCTPRGMRADWWIRGIK